MSAPPGNWEGQSTARPPFFNGQYYSWWKNRMRDHIIGEDYEFWNIVTDGPLATTKKNVEGVDMPKTRVNCTAEDLKKWEKNAKAKKWLVCGLGPDEYSRIQSCTTAKDIWDTLQVAHEGTPQVKRSRGTLLYSQCENFTMKEGETIQAMYTRFTTLTNELKSLGRIILEEDKVEKILTMESKNIATLKLDELIGNLTAYELRRQTRKMDAPKKERSLALRISEGADLEDDEMAMIIRDFKNLYEDSEDEAGDEQARMAIGESYDEQEVSVIHLKDKIKFLSKEKLSELLLDFIDESEVINNEKEQLSRECVILKASAKIWNSGLVKVIVQVNGSSQIWYMDSGCSKHMTGGKNRFLSLEDLKGGNVSFGNGKKGEIIGAGKEKRVNNIYIVDLSTLSENELTCLSVLDNDPLLWHKGLGHASLNQLNKLVSNDSIIPNKSAYCVNP
ncbi:uncharacterized protein [Nicotiana sylvestris]|uniref:uncharacterized protein n=1 Tax=Nicotiana sylvestris TaxID=4096 RepID=UPI00388CCA71